MIGFPYEDAGPAPTTQRYAHLDNDRVPLSLTAYAAFSPETDGSRLGWLQVSVIPAGT